MYPNGNGTVKGIYLSVFVEMYKGWSKMEGSYDYRIELVNRLDHSKVTSRQHVSEFETSVSWGYNRFIKLDQLEKENYLDPAEDLLEFRFYINPSNELQLLNDLTKYIENLEMTVKEVPRHLTKQSEEISSLKEGHNQNEDSSIDSDMRNKVAEMKKPEKEELEEEEMRENRVSLKGKCAKEKVTQEKQSKPEGVDPTETDKDCGEAGKNQAVQQSSD